MARKVGGRDDIDELLKRLDELPESSVLES